MGGEDHGLDKLSIAPGGPGSGGAIVDSCQNPWDRWFLELCCTISHNCKCLSRQIGAIVVRDRRIVSTGYNGPPVGMKHCEDTCPRQKAGYKSGEGLHLCPASHAEVNAIINAAKLGVSTDGCTMYMNCGVPCKDCLKYIINAGIREVVCTSTEFYDDLSKEVLQYCELEVRTFL